MCIIPHRLELTVDNKKLVDVFQKGCTYCVLILEKPDNFDFLDCGPDHLLFSLKANVSQERHC